MQKLLFPCVIALFLSACSGTTQPSTETSSTVKAPTFSNADLVGLYHGKVSNTLGFFVIISESNGQLEFVKCENPEEEVTMEFIKENPEDFPFTPFSSFELSEDRTEFTSDWGEGRIQRDQYGLALIFEKIPGTMDPRLGTGDEKAALYKVVE